MSEPSSKGAAETKAWLRTVFDRHDLNRDGRLTLGEFIRLTRWLDSAATTEECESVFDSLDCDQSGAIDFEPFFHWWARRAS